MNRSIQIKPFKKKNQANDQYEQIWDRLKSAITQIHNKNASSLSFEELYRNAYNLVVQRHGDYLYKNVKELITSHLHSIVCAKLANVKGVELLQRIKKVWSDFKISMVMIRDILLYMDRMYVKTAKVPPVYDMGMDIFRETVLRSKEFKIRDKFIHAFLDQVQADRKGEDVDAGLLKSMTGMLVALGNDNLGSHTSYTLRTVYCIDFEDEFILCSKNFYKQESTEYLKENDAISYLKTAELRFKEEDERVKLYLFYETLPKLRTVLEAELISAHLKTIVKMENSGLKFMLQNKRIQDLAILHKLFGYVDGGLDLVRQISSEYISDCGEKINSTALSESQEKGSTQNLTKTNFLSVAIQWVQSMLDLKSDLDECLKKAFTDSKTETCFNDALNSVVCKNPKAAEFLAIYFDDNLNKKSKKTEEELEQIVERTIHLFRFVPDKDVFERFYKQFLAKRLLNDRSVSSDIERLVIAKFKSECGKQFTSKLEGMFLDMKLSNDVMDGFKEFINNSGKRLTCEMNVNTLTATNWPINSKGVKSNDFDLFPESLKESASIYSQYYLNKHNGRQLYWQLNLGTVEIVANLGRKHELIVSFYKGIILLCFNDNESLTFEQIQGKLNVPEVELFRSLQSLACGKFKILSKTPKSRDVSKTDSFTLNTAFSSPHYRIKIPVISIQQQEESKETMHKVEESRKFEISAAIVRIMKSNKEMEHSLLIADVCAQLSGRFNPDPLLIKKQIEVLIDREYLERVGVKMYRYLA